MKRYDIDYRFTFREYPKSFEPIFEVEGRMVGVNESSLGDWVKYESVKNILSQIESACGIPDSAEACRTILKICKESKE